MEGEKIAVIGGGIVGLSTAYYLAKANKDVSLFDDGTGQATRAAAGIICPWLSQRRSQIWYRLACEGAAFYPEFIEELGAQQAYHRHGCVITHDDKLEEFYQKGMEYAKKDDSIGNLMLLDDFSLTHYLPVDIKVKKALFVSGAAYVDGALLVQKLLLKCLELGVSYEYKRVSFKEHETFYEVGGHAYDALILATGAWLPALFPDLEVDIKPQKGELIEFARVVKPGKYAVLMPQGEVDLLFDEKGNVIVGASHENDRDYDLSPDKEVQARLKRLGARFLPILRHRNIVRSRIGIRGVSSDFLPFYGRVPHYRRIYVAGGLGSSGLTLGPLLGKKIAQMLITGDDFSLNSPIRYMRKKA